jgi:thiol-disulfide isomerase/thioredoxin
MRRRELVAGLASAAALGGAGLLAAGATPEGFGESDPATVGDGSGDGDGGSTAGGGTGSGAETGAGTVESMSIETLDAPGSRDGELTVPASDRPTFVDFFGTWCPPCAEQMPALGEANDRVGDEVLFVSVTTEPVGRSVAESTVVEWWREHDGDWLVGADPTAELAARVNLGGYPTAAVIDATGRLRWSESGIHTADELVARIEAVLEG